MIQRDVNVDIWETPEGLWLQADLPGVDEKSIDVKLDDRVLTVSGQLAEEPSAVPAHREYELGSFERRFRLSQDLDADAIEARLKDGVLELRLPRAEHAKPRRIEISG